MNRLARYMLLLLAGLALAPHAGAQVGRKPTLTLEGARRVVGAAVAEARKSNAGGAIAVVDEGGNLMLLERLDGTFAAGANISIGKARTAALFKRPTSLFEKIIREGRTPMVALSDFTPLQGGVPILIEGEVVGAVGVSGAASAQQDEEIAVAAANALGTTTDGTNGAAGKPAGVVHIEARKVAAAFAKGMPLLEVDGYKIHASHREKAGMAEVHTQDTDIIHVLKGRATFVTGGKVIGGRTTAPDEIRGEAIEGGDTRRLEPGDVIVVPNGVPHWFKEVSAPFDYYVVKVN